MHRLVSYAKVLGSLHRLISLPSSMLVDGGSRRLDRSWIKSERDVADPGKHRDGTIFTGCLKKLFANGSAQMPIELLFAKSTLSVLVNAKKELPIVTNGSPHLQTAYLKGIRCYQEDIGQTTLLLKFHGNKVTSIYAFTKNTTLESASDRMQSPSCQHPIVSSAVSYGDKGDSDFI